MEIFIWWVDTLTDYLIIVTAIGVFSTWGLGNPYCDVMSKVYVFAGRKLVNLGLTLCQLLNRVL